MATPDTKQKAQVNRPRIHVGSVKPGGAERQRTPLLFIHGAANGAWVWERWQRALAARGWETHAVDLRGHGKSEPVDLSRTTMEDYVSDVRRVAAKLLRPPALVGWSMGGLVAQMYASAHQETPALVLLAPSPPAEVLGAGSPSDVQAIPDLFGPEHYGIGEDPAAARAVLFDLTDTEAERVVCFCRGALESGLARRQRKAGVSVPAEAVGHPVLVVYGENDRHFPPQLTRKLLDYYCGAGLAVPGASHWGLVASEAAVARAAPVVDRWLKETVGATR